MEETLIFIDAGLLSKLSRYLGKGKYLVYDIIKFTKNLARKESLTCQQIFYYTAPPFQSEPPLKEEIKRKERYDKFIKKLLKTKEVIIREGRCQRLKIDGKFIYKQKVVDSLMIMDLMRTPIDCPNIKKIIILASDSDFVPIIKYLRKLNMEIILYTNYSKKRESNLSRSNELLKVVNRYVELTKQDFDDAPLDKSLVGG
ncbi:MAG TPA: NYN domain-containing protein [Nanoarchaeota archaeon]|nr:NYN domain-containing protein [Nanoarchaeota archaeon]HIH34265.1 NYN domain-containing protein [Nanoarchaeota archaeon]HIH50877.1 NYN domain-containing protein [Nanoarchaeota archaeon]